MTRRDDDDQGDGSARNDDCGDDERDEQPGVPRCGGARG